MPSMEYLMCQRNRLVDQWRQKSGQEKVKLLVQIIDIEDDISELQKSSKQRAKVAK